MCFFLCFKIIHPDGKLDYKLYSTTITTTTSVNGNAVFQQLRVGETEILSIVCLSNKTTLTIPYKVNDVYWGCHCYKDSLIPETIASEELQFRIKYIKI